MQQPAQFLFGMDFSTQRQQQPQQQESNTALMLAKLGMHNPFEVFFSQLLLGNATEMAAILVFFLYCLAFVWFGIKRRNEKRAFMLSALREMLQSQFALVHESFGDSFNEIVIYATGRKNCKSCTVTLTLANSHDLLSLLTKSTPLERVLIRIDFLESDPVLPFVFALVNNSNNMAKLLAQADDVRIFGREEYSIGPFTCKSENKQCNPLPASVQQVLMDNAAMVDWLVLSDQINLKQLDMADRAIYMQIALPRTPENFQVLVQSMCDLADHVQTFGVSLFPTYQAQQGAVDARARIRVLKQQQQVEGKKKQ